MPMEKRDYIDDRNNPFFVIQCRVYIGVFYDTEM